MTTTPSTTLLIRYAEIGLKKGNRRFFENKLRMRIHKALPEVHGSQTRVADKHLWVACASHEAETFAQRLSHVPGISSIRLCTVLPPEAETLQDHFIHILQNHPLSTQAVSFAIRCRRSDKKFPFTSDELNVRLGGCALETCPRWRVQLKDPQLTITILISEHGIYISLRDISGPGGLPVGTAGRLALLISGGIDSPVAGYHMQRRGAELVAIYFHSFPYTGDQALNKVKDLSAVLSRQQDGLRLHVVHFTDIQEAIRTHCHARYSVPLNRRMMMRIAEKIALQESCLGLITGESLGQVASQTLPNMDIVGSATKMQVYRPLIAGDKIDIIATARKLGTLDISNRPYADCCTLFMDKHPIIRARRSMIEEQEALLNIPELIAQALEKTTLHVIA